MTKVLVLPDDKNKITKKHKTQSVISYIIYTKIFIITNLQVLWVDTYKEVNGRTNVETRLFKEHYYHDDVRIIPKSRFIVI